MSNELERCSNAELAALWRYHEGEHALWEKTGLAPIRIVGHEVLPQWSEAKYLAVRAVVAERLPELLEQGPSYER